MRLNQFVASASGLSRRAADTAISEGRVTIAGRPAGLGEIVPEITSDIRLDGQVLKTPATATYIILNKPAGYIASRAKQGSAPTIYELLPPKFHNLRPAGRLDRDSSGLMLLSSDGPFIYRFSHPSAAKRKIYELTLSHPLAGADREHLARGVELDDGPSRVTVESGQGNKLTVSLITGRNRQLRRTFGALGYRIDRLHRTHIGDFTLGDLKSGAWQEVKPQ